MSKRTDRVPSIAVAWFYPDGKPYTLSWAGPDEARVQEARASFNLLRVPLTYVSGQADTLGLLRSNTGLGAQRKVKLDPKATKDR